MTSAGGRDSGSSAEAQADWWPHASWKNPDTYFLFSCLKTISADFLGNSSSPWKPWSQVTTRIQSGAVIFRLYALAGRLGLPAAPARWVRWPIPGHGLVSSPSQLALFGSVHWSLPSFIQKYFYIIIYKNHVKFIEIYVQRCHSKKSEWIIKLFNKIGQIHKLGFNSAIKTL